MGRSSRVNSNFEHIDASLIIIWFDLLASIIIRGYFCIECAIPRKKERDEMSKKDFARNSPYTFPFEAAIRAFLLADPRTNVSPNLEQTYT